MINYIKGKITDAYEGVLIIERDGIGYELNVPASSLYMANEDEEVTVFTYMAVREDDISLYGFHDRESLRIFRMLISVSGVGAKAGMSILSALTTDEIKQAVMYDRPEVLARAQGIGKKTAQRLVLELADKMKDEEAAVISNVSSDVSAGNIKENLMIVNETVEALLALGYMKSEASDAVAAVDEKDAKSVQSCLKAALKIMARR
ncbi:MAG: Holliday junction branch migration protein RuvA [Anaerovoracaceae bacterium]